MYAISYSDITAAALRIGPHIIRTPVLTCSALSAAASHALGIRVEIFLKCELFQKTGSFKVRGAMNAVFSLSDDAAALGVCTHSSGNHAAALAAAAAARGCAATVVMPRDAPELKVTATAGYGARIEMCPPGAPARAAAAAAIVTRTGASFVHPSENPGVIAGQGTVAVEFLEQMVEMTGAYPRQTMDCFQSACSSPALDAILVPVGGGGLVSGCAIGARGVDARVRVIGAEPLGVAGDGADAARSLAANKLCTHSDAGAPELLTCADGLRTSLGPNTWPIIRDHVPYIVTVSEDAVALALCDVFERAKLVIEPSAAVGIAATREASFLTALGGDLLETAKQRPLRIGVVLCGGNADICAIAQLLANVPRLE